MSIYVECADPRVLAAHRAAREGVDVGSPSGEWGCRTELEFAPDFANLLAAGWRCRLVFPDAEAAGKGLIDYRERLRARVLVSPEPGAAETQSVAPLSGDIVSALNGGSVYRIAAQAEEPRPAEWVPTLGEVALLDGKRRVTVEAVTYRARAAGVPFVDINPDRLSPLPPEPETERVPWPIALRYGRKVRFDCADGGVEYVLPWTAERRPGRGIALCVSGKDCTPPADDGTVEVLKDGGGA